MKSVAVIVGRPAIDFGVLMSAASQMFEHNPAKSVDQCKRSLSDSERLLSIMSAFNDPTAPVALHERLLNHACFSVLLVADERDMIHVLGCTAGMANWTANTKFRDIVGTVVTGNLAQWREAVLNGTRSNIPIVRSLFNHILSLFVNEGIDVWRDYKPTELNDKTFLLVRK